MRIYYYKFSITIAKKIIVLKILGVTWTTPDKTKPSPIHKPAQAIISCLKVPSSGPLKFKITANHNEGKISAAMANLAIIEFLSVTDFSSRSNTYTMRNKGSAE